MSVESGSKSKLDALQSDLKSQLETIDELDWDYFLETAIKAKIQADHENRNMAFSQEASSVMEIAKSVVSFEEKT